MELKGCLEVRADKNKMIQAHIPFIIKTVSEVVGRYVTLENDEMSIALLAFNEAVDKYDETKGPFLAFAKLVIRSRILTYLQSNQKHQNMDSIEALHEAGIELSESCYQPMVKETHELKWELDLLKEQLLKFGFDLEILASECPKHRDTRRKAITLAEQINDDKSIVFKLYEKLRLPIKLICLQYEVTEKFVKGSKKFIITVVIIFDKQLKTLLPWLEGR